MDDADSEILLKLDIALEWHMISFYVLDFIVKLSWFLQNTLLEIAFAYLFFTRIIIDGAVLELTYNGVQLWV